MRRIALLLGLSSAALATGLTAQDIELPAADSAVRTFTWVGVGAGKATDITDGLSIGVVGSALRKQRLITLRYIYVTDIEYDMRGQELTEYALLIGLGRKYSRTAIGAGIGPAHLGGALAYGPSYSKIWKEYSDWGLGLHAQAMVVHPRRAFTLGANAYGHVNADKRLAGLLLFIGIGNLFDKPDR